MGEIKMDILSINDSTDESTKDQKGRYKYGSLTPALSSKVNYDAPQFQTNEIFNPLYR